MSEQYITKIVLKNFKRFRDLTLEFNKDRNILVGDNESGKSTILQAIDIALSGSFAKIDSYGLQNLLNVNAVSEFMKLSREKRKIADIPQFYVEIFFNDLNDFYFEGKNNSQNENASGIRLSFELNEEYNEIVENLLTSDNTIFPIEYFRISFKTFADQIYDRYKKKGFSIFIDNSNTTGDYVMRDYIKKLYYANTTDEDRNNFQHEYRRLSDSFNSNQLATLNSGSRDYVFNLDPTHKFKLENVLQLYSDGINIVHRGLGFQNIVMTKHTLMTKQAPNIVLIEEPETHLSHIKTKELLDCIEAYTSPQMIIATHSNMIASRLGLKNIIMMNSKSETPSPLMYLSDETSRFFMRSTNSGILDFLLSGNVILVEGNAEFILMEYFIEKELKIKNHNTHVISVNGLSFKRYLDVAAILKKKVCVITDNDGDYTKNVTNRYQYYSNFPFIRICSDPNDDNFTFEKCVYLCNKLLCDEVFKGHSSAIEYMLKNKANAAFELLNSKKDITPPEYIQGAIRWINS